MFKITERQLYLGAFGSLPGVGSVTLKHLFQELKGPEQAWKTIADGTVDWAKLQLTKRTQLVLKDGIKEFNLERLRGQLERWHIGVIGFDDEIYPPQLKEIFNPPVVLFYRGNVELLKRQEMIAMVGARQCSVYGRNVANVLASKLGVAGVVIISGGAKGIDSYSHEGVLVAKGATIAVMGCGLEQSYPRSNGLLFRRIIEDGGLLLSEYGPGISPKPYHFPMRNRIISGLARAVIVVEAKSRSGSLITADLAINEGRDVFTVPGNILIPDFEGNHWLVSQGATLLTKAEQILDTYGWNRYGVERGSYNLFSHIESSNADRDEVTVKGVKSDIYIEKSDRNGKPENAVNKGSGKACDSLDNKKDSSHNGTPMISFNVEERKILEALSNEKETSLEHLAVLTNLSEGALHLGLLNLELRRCIERTPTKGYIILDLGRNQFVH